MQQVAIFIRYNPETCETTVEQFNDHPGKSYPCLLGMIAVRAIKQAMQNDPQLVELTEVQFDPSNN